MVEGGGLENRCAARYRGFESPLLRSERCESGRIGLPAKELFPIRVPGVRIPPFPYFLKCVNFRKLRLQVLLHRLYKI